MCLNTRFLLPLFFQRTLHKLMNSIFFSEFYYNKIYPCFYEADIKVSGARSCQSTKYKTYLSEYSAYWSKKFSALMLTKTNLVVSSSKISNLVHITIANLKGICVKSRRCSNSREKKSILTVGGVRQFRYLKFFNYLKKE